MNKKIFYILGIVILLVLLYMGYRSSQPVQPESGSDWEAVIASRGLVREPFFVENNNIKLEAEVIRSSNGLAEKSAVIFIPGSGNTTFQAYAPGLIEKYVLDVFIPRDYAVVFLNKRGMGLSEGNWMKNDFPGRADDVLAAADVVRNMPGIDANHVGLIGHSQGGWIANLAAAQNTEIDFFISLAGPVTSVQEQMADIYENDFRCQGFDGDELLKKTNRQLNLARLGASIGRVLPVGVIGFDAGIIDYDPLDIVLTTTSPGLFVFGEHDPYVPADQNLASCNEIFPGGSANLTVITVKQGDHHFRTTQSICQPYEERLKEPFSEALLKDMNAWLDKQGL